MLNIVEKYSAETAVESEDGVVAIEYVIVASALVDALGPDGRDVEALGTLVRRLRAATAR